MKSTREAKKWESQGKYREPSGIMEVDLRGGVPGIGRLVDESLAIAWDLHYKRLVFKSKTPWTLSLF